MFARLLAGSTVAAFFLVVAITVAALQQRDAPQSGAQAARSPQPSPTATVSFDPAQPAALLRSAGSKAGYDRVTSVDGGWSLEIPTTWIAESAPMRGGEMASFDLRGAQFEGNAPASNQLRMRVRLVTDYDGTPLETLGARDVPNWLVVSQTRTTVSGRDAVRTVRNAYVPAGSPFDQQRVVWDFRSPFLTDRVVVVEAWPADGLLATEADQALTTFELSAALPAATVPKISRPNAMARSSEYAASFGTPAGSTAKLVLFSEYDKAQIAEAKRSGGPYSVGGSVDPDQLVWIVVVRGDFEQMKGGPPPGGPRGLGATFAPPPRLVWLALIVNAIDGSVGNYIPGLRGDGPAWFGALGDRAH